MIYFMLASTGKTISASPSHIGEEWDKWAIPKTPMHVQADGDELIACLRILGRGWTSNKVHLFIGESAQEIAFNWQ